MYLRRTDVIDKKLYKKFPHDEKLDTLPKKKERKSRKKKSKFGQTTQSPCKFLKHTEMTN